MWVVLEKRRYRSVMHLFSHDCHSDQEANSNLWGLSHFIRSQVTPTCGPAFAFVP